jgi:hypothetical protein
MYKNLIVVCGFIITLSLNASVSATIISSYDAGAEVTISTDFDIFDLETALFDEFEDGGTASGTGDGIFDLSAGSSTTVSAFASGEIVSHPADIGSYHLADALFFFDNSTSADITGTATFDLSFFASIFTDTLDESAFAFSSVFIDFEHVNVDGLTIDSGTIFDSFFDFDSSFEGVGTFGDTFATLPPIEKELTIGAGDSVSFYLEVDADGGAGSTRAAPPTTVPEPSTLVIFALSIMGLASNRMRTPPVSG